VVTIVIVATFGGVGTIQSLEGLTVTSGPLGETVADRVTVDEKPFRLVNVIVRLALDPC
jgi:hypothetical protein